MTKLSVPDMTCGHCKAAVEKAIHNLDASVGVDVNLQDRTVEVSGAPNLDAVLSALKGEGYTASVIS